MHACGHDGHVAILLSAARVLGGCRDRLAGTVKFVFQPSEGRPPGGANRMIEEGVLDAPKVDAAFGLHLIQTHPVGAVVAQPGPRFAAIDTFRSDIVGQGGSTGMAHLAVDPVLTAAHVITALNTIVGREVNPAERAVIAVTMVQAGTAPNVIPSTATLGGLVRTYTPDLLRRLRQRIEEFANGAAAMTGTQARFHYDEGYPTLVNDTAMAALVADVAAEVVGAERVIPGVSIMAGEDMAYFLERVPGCYFEVGTRNEVRGITGRHHQPRYDLDEAALPIGVEMFVRTVERYLADQRLRRARKPEVNSRSRSCPDHAPRDRIGARCVGLKRAKRTDRSGTSLSENPLDIS
jgi:amidohydrolase